MNSDNINNPNTLSLSYADRLWQSWQEDPASVPQAWRDWFEAQGGAAPSTPGYQTSGDAADRALADQNKVDQLVRNYRVRGHRIAKLNPLKKPAPPPPELTLAYYGFSDADLDRVFSAGTLSPGDMLPLREIQRRLQATYSRFIGVQYMHIDDLQVREWLQTRMEPTENRTELHPEVQRRILQRLIDAENFEEFIQNKYLGRQALQPRGRRDRDPAAGHGHRARGPAGPGQDRHRHGPPRPPERAGQHPGQEPAQDLRRVRGHRPRALPRATAT